MRFILDENAPRSLGDYLESVGHTVILAREHFGPKTLDPLIARYAHDERLIVVTWNVKHFEKALGLKGGFGPCAEASALFFRDVEQGASVARLRAVAHLLEAEFDFAATRAVRCVLYVHPDRITVVR